MRITYKKRGAFFLNLWQKSNQTHCKLIPLDISFYFYQSICTQYNSDARIALCYKSVHVELKSSFVLIN